MSLFPLLGLSVAMPLAAIATEQASKIVAREAKILFSTAGSSSLNRSRAARPAEGPDLIVSDLPDIRTWGMVDGIIGYSIATDSCNIGDAPIPFEPLSNQHPVIAQHLYRLKDGHFEQIGMSWVKHAFGALALSQCGDCRDTEDRALLGVGCNDPYTSSTNGTQEGISQGSRGGLGPRSEINALTGEFPFPYTTQGQGGDAIFKRLQVHRDDLDPALNPSAIYFAEALYIVPSDGVFSTQNNNASYRRVVVAEAADRAAATQDDLASQETFVLTMVGNTLVEQAAIQAWARFDEGVTIDAFDDPDGGRFFHARRCTANGDGTWHYEYAVYNMTSHRAARSFTIPVADQLVVSNVGFHDVAYHSGEVYDGADSPSEMVLQNSADSQSETNSDSETPAQSETRPSGSGPSETRPSGSGISETDLQDETDWQIEITAEHIRWQTDDFATNPNANALRWGTLYNFRFDANAPPIETEATIELFRTGAPSTLTIRSIGPNPLGGPDTDTPPEPTGPDSPGATPGDQDPITPPGNGIAPRPNSPCGAMSASMLWLFVGLAGWRGLVAMRRRRHAAPRRYPPDGGKIRTSQD